MIAVNIQTSEQLEKRYPLHHQRLAADRAQQRAAAALDKRVGTVNRTHSRGLSAAAISDTTPIKLGIDAEWPDPARPWPAIMQRIRVTPTTPITMSPALGCRVWTFYEAWYKAFGEYTDGRILTRWAETSPPVRTVIELDSDLYAWRAQLKGFEICILWRGIEQDVVWVDGPA